jgi:hypothetical protein
MTESLRTPLNKLKELAPQVNRLADEAAKTVREIEQLLADKLGLTVSAETGVSYIQTSTQTAEHTNLAYRRVGGKFRIAVVKERCTNFVNDRNWADTAWKTLDETPWLECPRDEKLATFPKLPKLLEAIVEAVEKSVAAVQQAQPEVEAVLNSMK